MEREWRCPKSAAIGAARVSRPRLGRSPSVLGLAAWAWLGTSLAEAQSPAGAPSGGTPVLLALNAGFVFAVLVLAVILFVLARKDVRVVVSSGYNRQEATQQFAGKGLAGFIQKPYKAEDLLECVREAWDGDSPVDAPCPDSAE